MATIEDQLAGIEQLLAKGHAKEPEALLRQLLSEMGPTEVAEWRVDLQRLIDRFQPKRRGELSTQLKNALEDRRPQTAPKRLTPQPAADLSVLEEQLRADLRDLSLRHIFQWSTFYRDCLTEHFRRLLTAAETGQADEAAVITRRAIAEHSNEIFTKGYSYVRMQMALSQLEAHQKALGGLSKFLDIVVELYSTRASAAPDADTLHHVRQLGSSLLTGVLEGFATCRFGADSGRELLTQFPRVWAHYYAFLRSRDAEEITGMLEPGDFAEGISATVLPTLGALEDLFARSGDYAPFPVLGQFVWDERRLDIAMRPSWEGDGQALMEVTCFTNEAFASAYNLQESEARGATVIVAAVKGDVAEFVQAHPTLRKNVIAVGAASTATDIRRLVYARLDDEVYQRFSPRVAGRPLAHNIARDFPLRNPFKVRYYHVPRTSVRDLLRAFERRNGVRLWCSVRRSGKTTACFDLGTTTGASTVVSQTCDSTEQVANAHLFYDLVLHALEAGTQLDPTFVEATVARCAPPHAAELSRFVLVIDEYETLFGRLRSAVRKDGDLRYTVVQPLLNQLVAFTRDNLLVLMGQQPNAHFILMDQNQLSAYVEPDSFPLFQHTAGTVTGEFAELVRKILTDRIAFDPSFADAVYAEAAGHPFLTANVLVELVEWLIDTKRPAKALRLRREDFDAFARDRLTPERLRLSSEYDFFRAAASEAMSLDGAAMNPWLHSIYSVLQLIAKSSTGRMEVTREGFRRACEAARVKDLGFDADEILRSGTQANFFEYDKTMVRPKVRLLGRLAAVARARIAA